MQKFWRGENTEVFFHSLPLFIQVFCLAQKFFWLFLSCLYRTTAKIYFGKKNIKRNRRAVYHGYRIIQDIRANSGFTAPVLRGDSAGALQNYNVVTHVAQNWLLT